jgi:hypothetical protein
MHVSRIISTTMVAGIAALASLQPAAAAPSMVDSGIGKAATNVENVQYRHGRGGPGWRHDGWRHRHHYGHRGYGAGAAALGGLAAGAIIGGAIANGQARAADSDAYCSQRYKSYDPASGTYLGYDGARHACP